MPSPRKPAQGSIQLAAVLPNADANGNPVVWPIFLDDSYDPARLIIELPDRALRDLGKVDIASIDSGGLSAETSTVYNATTALTPKFAKIAASSSGDNTLVSAVATKKLRVLAYNFMSNGTVNAKFQSGASGTDLTGLKYCVANTGICAGFNQVGWFETTAGALLNLNLSSGVAVGGELVYVEV